MISRRLQVTSLITATPSSLPQLLMRDDLSPVVTGGESYIATFVAVDKQLCYSRREFNQSGPLTDSTTVESVSGHD